MIVLRESYENPSADWLNSFFVNYTERITEDTAYRSDCCLLVKVMGENTYKLRIINKLAACQNRNSLCPAVFTIAIISEMNSL